jgi:hypothetical protein
MSSREHKSLALTPHGRSTDDPAETRLPQAAAIPLHRESFYDSLQGTSLLS